MVNPYPFSGTPDAFTFGLVANASNVRTGDNSAYTSTMFLADFEQFTGLLPVPILTQFIAMADAVVQEVRWHESWRYGMGLFIAHFGTLFLQARAGDNPTASQVVSAAQSRGLTTSESVGDVSASYDFSHITADLSGWASWTATSYGLQFAQMGKLLGRGSMYVW